MSKSLTITINKAAVVEAIKGDTSITGNVDRAIDPNKNAGMAYNEQAGDDDHHLKKIDLLIRTAVSKFAAEMATFTDGSAGSVTTNISTSITIVMVVTDRYMSGLADPLAGLAQSYIVNMALYGWWISIKPEMAKGFAAMAADALAYVNKCFAKAAPTTSTSSYNDVIGTVEDVPTKVSTPTFSFVMLTRKLSIACNTAGATIYYTSDGSTPTTASTQYTEPLTYSFGTTIKAIAVKEGLENSEINSWLRESNIGGGGNIGDGSGEQSGHDVIDDDGTSTGHDVTP